MVVGPEGSCWPCGRTVRTREGAACAEEFARFPTLRVVVRDDGTGLGNGVEREHVRRLAARQPDLDDTPHVVPDRLGRGPRQRRGIVPGFTRHDAHASLARISALSSPVAVIDP
jgi:hypothetical protein